MKNQICDRDTWVKITDPRGYTTWLDPRHPVVMSALMHGMTPQDLLQISSQITTEVIESGQPLDEWNAGGGSWAFIEETK